MQCLYEQNIRMKKEETLGDNASADSATGPVDASAILRLSVSCPSTEFLGQMRCSDVRVCGVALHGLAT